MSVYYGTHIRAGELLVGALLAVVVSNPGFRKALRVRRTRLSKLTGRIGVGAAVATSILWATATVGGGFVRHGGLFATSLLSASLILACMSRTGPLRVMLSARPLIWIGTVSYGIYLFHWPIMVLCRQTRLSQPRQLLVTLSCTLLLAAMSARLVERPLRARLWPKCPSGSAAPECCSPASCW